MTIYLICLFSIPVYALLFYFLPVSRKKKNLVLCLTVGIQLILVAALRSVDVGGDLDYYIPGYKNIGESTWNEWSVVGWEPGYNLLNKILFLISNDERLLLVVHGVIIVSGYVYFTIRYSKIPWLSLFLFICLGYYTWTFSGLRQAIAMVVVLYGLKYVERKELLKFVLTVLLAMSFHLTAIVGILIYSFSKVKLNIENLLFGFIIVIFIQQILGKTILGLVINSLYTEYSLTDNGTGYNMLLLLIVVTVWGVLLKRKTNVWQDNIGLQMMCLACFMQFFALQLSMLARIVNYFSVYMIFFIPNTLCNVEDKNVRFLGLLLICSFAFLFFILLIDEDSSGIYPYQFMWE